MSVLKEAAVPEAVARLGLPLAFVMSYVNKAVPIVLRCPTFGAIDGYLCEGRRLHYALFDTGPPLRRYYKWPQSEGNVNEEEIYIAEALSEGLISVEWVPYVKFFE